MHAQYDLYKSPLMPLPWGDQTGIKSPTIPTHVPTQVRVRWGITLISACIMSKNPSTNCYHRLRRLNVGYQGEISLHLDLRSQYGHRTWSRLLWALIRILYLDTARYIELLSIRLPFNFLGIEEQSSTVVNIEIRPLLDLYIHFEPRSI